MVMFALTGWGQDDDRRRSKEAAFDNHLVRPIDLIALEQLLASTGAVQNPLLQRSVVGATRRSSCSSSASFALFNHYQSPSHDMETTLRYYDLFDALKRMVDFDLVSCGAPPKFYREIAGMVGETAKRLYAESVRCGVSDLAMSEPDMATQKAIKIVSFCRASTSLHGLESMYLTSLSVLRTHGTVGEYGHALEVLDRVAPLQRLGGGGKAAIHFDSTDRVFSALSYGAVAGLLNPTDIARGLRGKDDVRTQVQRGVLQDIGDAFVAPFDCKDTIKTLVATAGGVAGSPSVAGAAFGAVWGWATGGYLAEMLCGGTTPAGGSPGATPSPTTAPAPAPAPATAPAPSSPAPSPSPREEAPAPAPRTTAGGPGDDPLDPNDNGGTMVARPVNPNIDRDDPTDRDPEPDDGRAPRVAQVMRVKSNPFLPEAFAEAISRTDNPNVRSARLLPKVVNLNGAAVIDWGVAAPYILIANGDHERVLRDLNDLVNGGGVIADPLHPGRFIVNPGIWNPKRDLARELLSGFRSDSNRRFGL